MYLSKLVLKLGRRCYQKNKCCLHRIAIGGPARAEEMSSSMEGTLFILSRIEIELVTSSRTSDNGHSIVSVGCSMAQLFMAWNIDCPSNE